VWNLSFASPDVVPWYHITFFVLAFTVFFRKWQRRWSSGTTMVLIFLIWIWICTLTAQYWDIALARAVMTTKYLVPTLIISMALTDRKAQKWFVYTLAYSVGIWLAWSGFHALFIMHGQASIYMSIRGGQMTDRNDFLVACTGCLPLMLFCARHYGGPYPRLVRLATFGMILLGLVAFPLSHSRGAFIGLAALIMFYIVAAGSTIRRRVLVLVVALAAVPLIPSHVWKRLDTISTEGEQVEASAVSRVESFWIGVHMTRDYPVFGVGPGSFPDVAARYSHNQHEPHTLWVKCSAELGIPMLAFFLMCLAYLSWNLRHITKTARKKRDLETADLAMALLCGIWGFLLTGSFTSQFLSEYLWNMIALAATFITAEKLRAATRPPAAGPVEIPAERPRRRPERPGGTGAGRAPWSPNYR